MGKIDELPPASEGRLPSIITDTDMQAMAMHIARNSHHGSPGDARDLLAFLERFIERKIAQFATSC